MKILPSEPKKELNLEQQQLSSSFSDPFDCHKNRIHFKLSDLVNVTFAFDDQQLYKAHKMSSNVKTRATKRKVENNVKQTNKKTAKLLDSPQEQLVLEFNELKSKYEKLSVQNKSNLEKVAFLNKKVLHLETEAKKNQKPESSSTESQTTMECEFCSYKPKDLIDLGEHQYQCHGPEDEIEEELIVCYICGWKQESKADLMKHRSEMHEQHVRLCQYFAKGCCDFTADDCWYRHELPRSQTIKIFKCGICENLLSLNGT